MDKVTDERMYQSYEFRTAA